MKLLTFHELWSMANAASQSCNDLCFHLCCDVWTSRAAKSKRASHVKCLTWRKLLLLLDKAAEDKKQSLQAKMVEEGWRLPAVLNEACQARPSPTFQQQIAFRLHQPAQDLRAGLTPLEFLRPNSDHSCQQALGIIHIYKLMHQNQVLLSNNKLFKTSLFYPDRTTRAKTNFETYTLIRSSISYFKASRPRFQAPSRLPLRRR